MTPHIGRYSRRYQQTGKENALESVKKHSLESSSKAPRLGLNVSGFQDEQNLFYCFSALRETAKCFL
jgi:hypothetical protein